jgi:phage host-nuclease inhibitor protein Gam
MTPEERVVKIMSLFVDLEINEKLADQQLNISKKAANLCKEYLSKCKSIQKEISGIMKEIEELDKTKVNEI